jgi:RNA polymerase sigma factor (sigma-70 family)
MRSFLRPRIPTHLRARFDAHDVMQDAFLSLSTCPGVLVVGDETDLRRFLVGVLVNGLRDEVRKHQRQCRSAKRENAGATALESIASSADQPSECAEKADMSAFLVKSMSLLPKTEQVLLWHRFVHGLTWVEISRRTGMSEPTVRRRSSEALGYLAQRRA